MENANIRTGRYGEQQAVLHLEMLGHLILHQNWKYRRREIDIISCFGQVLHFTEVKTRMGQAYGLPENAVNYKKIKSMQLAAAAYLELHPQWKRISFDILAIDLSGDKSDIRYFEDVS